MLRYISCLFLLSLLSGCAFVPEKVSLDTHHIVHKKQIGQKKRLSVQVVDLRASDDIGGRPSGYGPAATISLKDDLAVEMRKSLVTNLKAVGFLPLKDSTSTTERHLAVRILNLEYKQRAGFWTGHIDLVAGVELVATRYNRHLNKIYRVKKTMDVLFTPSSEADSKLINDTYKALIEKMFKDESWLRFLAKA